MESAKTESGTKTLTCPPKRGSSTLLLGGVFGLPFFYLLGRIRLVNVWACLLGGFLVGAMSGLLITLLAGIGSVAALIYGCQGAGAAAVFWVFWRLGPDPSATFARIWIREFAGPAD
jgi:hypothetical protein